MSKKDGGFGWKREHRCPGPAAFQWNAGGWFGSQVGSTAGCSTAAVEYACQVPWLRPLFSVVSFVLVNVDRNLAVAPARSDQAISGDSIRSSWLVGEFSGVLVMMSFDEFRPSGGRPSRGHERRQ